jgi:hypothetical protein
MRLLPVVFFCSIEARAVMHGMKTLLKFHWKKALKGKKLALMC